MATPQPQEESQPSAGTDTIGEPIACPNSAENIDSALPIAGTSKRPMDSTTDLAETSTSYHLKWINWNSGKIPIVMQSRNGPCPLIALMNVLLLKEKIKLPEMLEQITDDQLLGYIGECIMESKPDVRELADDVANYDEAKEDDSVQLNFEQHIHDAIEIMPKLKNGLDVNIRFTGITDFEYTPECIIFDLLRITLYHGWLVDPSMTELKSAIDRKSYNHLIDFIITNKNINTNFSEQYNQEEFAKVLIAEEFLDSSASQLTVYGLQELRSKVKDNEIGILFRNNHFLTLFKRDGQIYTLVTDHGYLTEDNVIWETLDNIEGAGKYLDSYFQSADSTNNEAVEKNRQELDQQIALYLSTCYRDLDSETPEGELRQTKSDFEMAKRLQMEEDRLANMERNEEPWPQLTTNQQAETPDCQRVTSLAAEANESSFRPQSSAARDPIEDESRRIENRARIGPIDERRESLGAAATASSQTIGSASSSRSRHRGAGSSGSKKSNCSVI